MTVRAQPPLARVGVRVACVSSGEACAVHAFAQQRARARPGAEWVCPRDVRGGCWRGAAAAVARRTRRWSTRAGARRTAALRCALLTAQRLGAGLARRCALRAGGGAKTAGGVALRCAPLGLPRRRPLGVAAAMRARGAALTALGPAAAMGVCDAVGHAQRAWDNDTARVTHMSCARTQRSLRPPPCPLRSPLTRSAAGPSSVHS